MTDPRVYQIEEYRQRLSKLAKCWKPHDGQKKVLRSIFNDGIKRVFIQAGRKWGKSELCMYAAWRIAMLNNRASVYVIGPTRKQQHEIMWATSRIQDFGPQQGTEVTQSDLRIRFPWKSFIKIDGSENFEAYRGTEYDLMIFDEFKDCDFRFYEAAYPNLLSRDGVIIIIGTPPDNDNHYIQLRDYTRDKEDWKFFYATSWENPHISHEWLKREKTAYYERGDGAIWEREYEARFIPGGANAVFPMFSSSNVRPYTVLDSEILHDKRNLQWYTVSDPGTSTVFCVLFICYNPYTSQVYVLDEIYEKDRNETSALKIWTRVQEKKKQLCPEIQASDWTDIYDEAAAWYRTEVSSHFGDALFPTRKFGGDKESQVSLIKDMLTKEKRLQIADRCKYFIWEMKNYITDNDGRYPKKDDHAIDCLRYFTDVCGYSFDIERARVKKKEEVVRFYSPDEDMRRIEAEEDIYSALEGDIPWYM